MVRTYVAMHGIQHKALAAVWQCNESTVTRLVKHGRVPNGRTTARIIAWLLEAEPRDIGSRK